MKRSDVTFRCLSSFQYFIIVSLIQFIYGQVFSRCFTNFVGEFTLMFFKLCGCKWKIEFLLRLKSPKSLHGNKCQKVAVLGKLTLLLFGRCCLEMQSFLRQKEVQFFQKVPSYLTDQVLRKCFFHGFTLNRLS